MDKKGQEQTVVSNETNIFAVEHCVRKQIAKIGWPRLPLCNESWGSLSIRSGYRFSTNRWHKLPNEGDTSLVNWDENIKPSEEEVQVWLQLSDPCPTVPMVRLFVRLVRTTVTLSVRMSLPLFSWTMMSSFLRMAVPRFV